MNIRINNLETSFSICYRRRLSQSAPAVQILILVKIMRSKIPYIIVSVLFVFGFTCFAQTPVPTPPVVGEVTIVATKGNVDPIYNEFRKLSDDKNSFGGAYATVNNVVLKRDAATFTLRSGELYFLAPAEGRTTGAVFIGDGEISLVPPVESERKMLKFFTESPELKEPFTELVMFFTDKTFEEVKQAPGVTMGTAGPQASKARDAFQDKESLLKLQFRYNMPTRILMDVYGGPRPGFFTCFIDGKKYSKLLFRLDPLGIEQVSPEQVMLQSYGEGDRAILTAFHLAAEYKKGTATNSEDRRLFDLVSHQIDLTIKGTKLIASDKATMIVRGAGQRVLPFNLFSPLRVKRIIGDKGEEVNFIQENKDRDGGLAVILAAAPEAGSKVSLNFEYEGEEAISQAGAGNFILLPRSTWYPNNGGTQFGDRAVFDITFRFPKFLTMVGIGELVEPEKIDGDMKTSHWSSKGVEMAVAGFNYGDFIKKETTDSVTGYKLEVLVNRELPDEIKQIQNNISAAQSRGAVTFTTLGALSTASMADFVLGEAQNSTRIYDTFFGKLPFNRIAMTQQPNTFFGQAWATLIYMPYLAFVGDTERVQLFGIRGGTDGFWREVAAHEVSHQWWGHSVGWTSYHDQWMSEGFAQLSTSLYIQYLKKDIAKFNDFWEEQRSQIVDSSPATRGIKPYTVGPVTQGYRLNTAKTGRIAQNLIYPKGAYILHMLRMMMIQRKGGDARFVAMMKDFIASHFNKDVSTEDFKAIVEKHITPDMDIDKNGKMDWFFDQWVYGTEVPAYKFEYTLSKTDGKNLLSGKITQSGVSENFAMLVPIYVDFGQGWVPLGSVTIVGSTPLEFTGIEIPQMPKRASICALSDVLATKIENVKK